MENLEDLATIITWENGKPLEDARTEVRYAANFFLWFSEEATRISGRTIHASAANSRVVTLKEPVGVCALIAPWNFPAAMITRKVGPAIAAGCTAVVKAPAEAPLTALALMALAERAGVPAGVVNCITALENTVEVGETLTTDPLVDKVSFTGSTAVGRLLMRQSASTLKRLSFELGGNAAFIVFDDADLDLALQGLLASKFRISGQTCVCANRIFVHESVHDKFVNMCIDALKKFQIGHGFAPGTTHGPLIHERAAARVDALVQDAVSQGAHVALGGKRLQHLGRTFFDMTVLTNINRNMKLCDEEIFGPVAAFCSFKGEDEVLEMANDTHMGLAGYFFSENISRCWRVAEALKVGMVGINTGKSIISCFLWSKRDSNHGSQAP